MIHCLDDDALLQLHAGEAAPGAHVHVRGCVACAARYERLASDLRTIVRTLESPPPLAARAHVHGALRRASTPLAAAAVIALALAAGYLHRPAAEPVQVSMRTTDVSLFATDLSTALFAAVGSPDVQGSISDMAYVEAALNGGWPCTRDGMLGAECDNQLGTLLLEPTSEEDDG